MRNKIKALTKIFVKDFYQNTKLVNKDVNNINKKSIWFWMYIVLGIVMTYISYQMISWLKSNEIPETFLIIYMIFILFILMLQSIVASSSVYFFSKDIELILPLPIKTKELLISKFNTLLIMTYITEIIFGVLPFYIYGFLVYTGVKYFILISFILAVIPIIISGTVSLATILLMKIFKFIKNRNMIQIVITFILSLGIFGIESILIGNIENLKNSMINLYISETLYTNDLEVVLRNAGMMFGLAVFIFIIFIIIGKKFYIKCILSITSNKKNNICNKKNIEIRNTKISIAYIKKELKNLIKHPSFFMQTVFPVIMITVTIIILGNILIPILRSTIQSDQTIMEELNKFSFSSEFIFIILGILQVIFSISNLSITAISRDGRDAIFIKYVPLNLYKQFIYKNVLQIVLNIIVSAIILVYIYYVIPNIGLVNVGLLFIESIILTMINSYLMLIIDLRMPYLNWTSEHSVVKKNNNKSFQYGFTIIMILIYMYLSNILKEINVTNAILIEIFIFLIMFIIINILVKKNINKLFNKIN